MQEIKGNKIIVVRNNKDRIIQSKNLFNPVPTLAQHSSFPVVPFIFKFNNWCMQPEPK